MLGDPVHRPTTVDEALAVLAEHPGATVVAGGTDLVPAVLAGRRPRPERLVSLRGIRELDGVVVAGGELVVGACTTWATLATDGQVGRRATALGDVARLLGGPATRAWATLGGALAQRSRSMDAGPALVALNAAVQVVRATLPGARTVPVADFLTAAPTEGELVLAVRIPVVDRATSAWVKLAPRRHLDIATVSAAVVLHPDHLSVGRVRAALGGLWPTARRVPPFEELASDRPLEQALAATSVTGSLGPVPGDRRVPEDYRRAVAGIALARALRAAAEAPGGTP